ncbi:hypothetical protein EDC04DRAFT_2721133, partial [Pisolithus marmoratus]
YIHVRGLLCGVTVSCSGSNPIQFRALFSLPCSRRHRHKMHLSAERTPFSYMIQAPASGFSPAFEGAARASPNPRLWENFIPYTESNLRALAWLSVINDGHRIAERMLSMLPDKGPPESCWNDQYEAHSWDIEPEVQVAGVTNGGALVLDGCRATSIRWMDFPEVSVQMTQSGFRQLAGKIVVFGIDHLHD